MAAQIGEVADAWADLGPTRRLSLSDRQTRPSPEVLRITGELALRYPPASHTDRDAHAARAALLAKDCADIDPAWLEEAANRWARREPFMPRACELREEALAIGRITDRRRVLPAPQKPPKPEPAPLTDDEIRTMSETFVALGIKLGEIDAERARRLRASG